MDSSVPDGFVSIPLYSQGAINSASQKLMTKEEKDKKDLESIEKKFEANSKNDNTYMPHLNLVQDLKNLIFTVFNVPADAFKEFSYNTFNNYADYLVANLFEGNQIKARINKEQEKELQEASKWRLTKPFQIQPQGQQQFVS